MPISPHCKNNSVITALGALNLSSAVIQGKPITLLWDVCCVQIWECGGRYHYPQLTNDDFSRVNEHCHKFLSKESKAGTLSSPLTVEDMTFGKILTILPKCTEPYGVTVFWNSAQRCSEEDFSRGLLPQGSCWDWKRWSGSSYSNTVRAAWTKTMISGGCERIYAHNTAMFLTCQGCGPQRNPISSIQRT